MADEREITAPIDNYLLGIADSLQRVQKQLNNTKVLSVDGQSYTTYQLPRLEFELKMSIQLDTITEGNNQERQVFKAVPVNALQGSRSAMEASQASTIKGAFIAVPSDLGKPPPIVRSMVQKLSLSTFNIIVNIQSAVGELISGIPVQFNIDWALTELLSAEKGINRANIFFDQAIVQTDVNGNAFSKLTVLAGRKIAVILDVLGKTEEIIVNRLSSEGIVGHVGFSQDLDIASDLADINGIGSATEALFISVGIHTLAELANADIDELIQKLEQITARNPAKASQVTRVMNALDAWKKEAQKQTSLEAVQKATDFLRRFFP